MIVSHRISFAICSKKKTHETNVRKQKEKKVINSTVSVKAKEEKEECKKKNEFQHRKFSFERERKAYEVSNKKTARITRNK